MFHVKHRQSGHGLDPVFNENEIDGREQPDSQHYGDESVEIDQQKKWREKHYQDSGYGQGFLQYRPGQG